jgi:hypothetical protein
MQALIKCIRPERRISMRTYKDAKTLAKSLRKSLSARNVLLSHSECLEIVAILAGFADWNTLSASLEVKSVQAVRSDGQSDLHPTIHDGTCNLPQTAAAEPLACSFCGKSTVRSLIEAGCSRGLGASQRCVFICDECVTLCAQVNADYIGNTTKPEAQAMQ